jgi:hypothetical protein
MKKNSPLQNILISRIDQFCGIDKLTQKLNSYKINLRPRDRMMFESIIQYNNNLYFGFVPCENDFIIYKESSFNALDLLDRELKSNNCKYLSFIHEHISVGVSYTKNIRRLA